jgi:quinol monooxygenase YgiN
MFLITIRMQAAPEKRKELSQAVTSLTGAIRNMRGCHRCDLCRSMEDDDEFCLLGEWENKEDLLTHLESELFKVLLGAASLLKKPHEMTIYKDLPSFQPYA